MKNIAKAPKIPDKSEFIPQQRSFSLKKEIDERVLKIPVKKNISMKQYFFTRSSKNEQNDETTFKKVVNEEEEKIVEKNK